MTNYNKPVAKEEVPEEIKMEVEAPEEVPAPEEVEVPKLETVIVEMPRVNVRKAPSKNSDVLAIVSKGDELTYKGAANKVWTEISTADIPKGFVMTELLRKV